MELYTFNFFPLKAETESLTLLCVVLPIKINLPQSQSIPPHDLVNPPIHKDYHSS